MSDDWQEPYLGKVCDMILRLDRESAFSADRIRLEKQRAEWPELWALLDTIVEIRAMKDKFS